MASRKNAKQPALNCSNSTKALKFILTTKTPDVAVFGVSFEHICLAPAPPPSYDLFEPPIKTDAPHLNHLKMKHPPLQLKNKPTH